MKKRMAKATPRPRAQAVRVSTRHLDLERRITDLEWKVAEILRILAGLEQSALRLERGEPALGWGNNTLIPPENT